VPTTGSSPVLAKTKKGVTKPIQKVKGKELTKKTGMTTETEPTKEPVAFYYVSTEVKINACLLRINCYPSKDVFLYEKLNEHRETMIYFVDLTFEDCKTGKCTEVYACMCDVSVCSAGICIINLLHTF
jgi:hypothetical protein